MKTKNLEIQKRFTMLYHSQNEKYGNSALLVLSAVIFLLGCFFFVNSIVEKVVINNPMDKVITFGWLYVALSGILSGLFLAILYFYIYNEHEVKNEHIVKIIICSFMCFFILVLVVIIPWIIFTTIILKIVSYRAKTTDNFSAFMMILVADLMIVLAIIWLEEKYFFIEFIQQIITIKVDLRTVPVQIFLALAIMEVSVVIINSIVFMAMRHIKEKEAHKEVEEYRKKQIGGLKSKYKHISKKVKALRRLDVDTGKYSNEKQNKINEDIRYLKTTLFKTQIFALIVVFLVAAFSNDSEIIPISSDIVNVVTVFTLIILYFDKRKELK